MARLFACPECRRIVAPTGTVAGLRVRCEACGTLIEIPIVPRGGGYHRRKPAQTWTWAVLGVVAAVLMVVAAVQIARNRGWSNREREVAQAVARSERDEASGRFAEALVEAEAALKIAKALDPSARKPLKVRRDRLALRESEADLAASAMAPDPVAALRALRARVESDPAREPVRNHVVEALSEALGRRAEKDLAEASRAAASSHPELAMGLCEGVARAADELGFERAGGVRDAARAIAEGVIGRIGVVLAPVEGEFVPALGSARAHAASLHPLASEALRRKGYIPKPSESAFLDAWDQVAPYKLAIEVVERLDGTFFQNPSNTTKLNLHVVLTKGPTVLWEARPFGKTRVPPPDMASFEMSRLSLGKARDPALEKRLHDDARTVLAENFVKSLQTLPPQAPKPPAKPGG